MKRIILLLVFITSALCLSAQDGIMKDFEISGDLRMGSNYLPLFGIHASENVALYTELMAIHKSGLGVGYFAFDDFMESRIRFVDVLYTNSWGKASLYGAMEYVWYDNSDAICLMPYIIGTYTSGSWAFQAANMMSCFPRSSEGKYEFTAYAKVMKNIFKDIDLHVTVWYDSLYKSHFYGATGIKVSLPKGFYVMGTLLHRENTECLVNFGWHF